MKHCRALRSAPDIVTIQQMVIIVIVVVVITCFSDYWRINQKCSLIIGGQTKNVSLLE